MEPSLDSQNRHQRIQGQNPLGKPEPGCHDGQLSQVRTSPGILVKTARLNRDSQTNPEAFSDAKDLLAKIADIRIYSSPKLSASVDDANSV